MLEKEKKKKKKKKKKREELPMLPSSTNCFKSDGSTESIISFDSNILLKSIMIFKINNLSYN